MSLPLNRIEMKRIYSWQRINAKASFHISSSCSNMAEYQSVAPDSAHDLELGPEASRSLVRGLPKQQIFSRSMDYNCFERLQRDESL